MAGNKDMMERVDMKAEFSKLSPTEQHFVKKAEQITQHRAMAQKSMLKRNYFLAGGFIVAAMCIYGYSITSVKQEKFLDEFDDMHKK